jgi:hypothetical protein
MKTRTIDHASRAAHRLAAEGSSSVDSTDASHANQDAAFWNGEDHS